MRQKVWRAIQSRPTTSSHSFTKMLVQLIQQHRQIVAWRKGNACIYCKQTLCSLMNSKHRKTLAVVFTDPVSGTVEWSAIENLLVAAGAQVIEGRGSRVRFEKEGEVETFHRPHPAKEAKRYQVRAARAFLERIGVTP